MTVGVVAAQMWLQLPAVTLLSTHPMVKKPVRKFDMGTIRLYVSLEEAVSCIRRAGLQDPDFGPKEYAYKCMSRLTSRACHVQQTHLQLHADCAKDVLQVLRLGVC